MTLLKKILPCPFLVCLLVFIFISGCTDTRYASEKLFWQAEKNFSRIASAKGRNLNEEDYQDIISGYKAVIRVYPLEILSAKAHFKISNLYLAQQKFDQAREELTVIIQNFSSNSSLAASARFSIAKIFEAEKKENQALEEYEKVPDLYPLTSLGLQTPLYLIKYFSDKEQTGKAEQYYIKYTGHYKKLLNDYSGTSIAPVILKHLALAHVVSLNPEKAVKTYDTIIADYPRTNDAVQAYAAKAEVYLKKMNDTSSAIETYETLISNYSGLPVVTGIKAQLGWLYLKNGDISRAEELFRIVKESGTSDQEAKLNSSLGLAYIFREQKNIDKAVSVYEQIRIDFPESRIAVAVPFLISQIYAETEDQRKESALDNAVFEYKDMLSNFAPGARQRTAAHYLTLAYIKKNEPEKALDILEDLVKQYPDNPGYMLDIAHMYTVLKENDKAIDVYSSLIDKYTDNEYLVNLSRSKIEYIHSMDNLPVISGPDIE